MQPTPRKESRTLSYWENLASFLASLDDKDRARFSAHAALDLSEGSAEGILRTLRAYDAEASGGASPSSLLATAMDAARGAA